jgi:hypothetical protein
MRILTLALVLGATTPAFAEPCFTDISRERANAAMSEVLTWPTTEAPLITGSLVLDCVGNDDLSITCRVKEQTPSVYPIAEASLAWARELRLCTPQRAHFEMPLTFMNS